MNETLPRARNARAFIDRGAEINSNVALASAVVCSSLAVGYLLGKIHGSRRYADDYFQRPLRACKKTKGLKAFLEYVAKYSSPEHPAVTELRGVG